MNKKLISIVTPTYNEVDNIGELLKRLHEVTANLERYDFEFIVIDNCSTDGTQELLRDLATKDFRLKVIFNARNFGHIRSPYYGILQSSGDATVYLASDFQDPPELIPEFIKEWELGYRLVMGIKPEAKGSKLFHAVRTLYYKLLNSIADIDLLENATGFGLYDKAVLNHLRAINDPYPYLRGLVCDLGYPIKKISFVQPTRLRGISKNNIYTLYDIGILGIVNHSKIPLRAATFFGFITGFASIAIALIYLILKLAYWNSFALGIAPIVISMFFLMGVLFILLGLLGEYILVMHTKLQNRPIVVESHRINF